MGRISVKKKVQPAWRELSLRPGADARQGDSRIRAFQRAFAEHVAVPCDATVIGEPVSVLEFGYDGNQYRGLTVTCRRPDGREFVVGALEMEFPPASPGACGMEAYRAWTGVTPLTRPAGGAVAGGSIPAKQEVELVVQSVLTDSRKTALCRFLGSERSVTLSANRGWVPGEILRARVRKKWTSGDEVLSAAIEATRIDASALGLTPLRLKPRGNWNPAEEYWGEPGRPIARWAKPIIKRGVRPVFEMEQVLPGYDWSDPNLDPIGMSIDHKDAGDTVTAYRILMGLCQTDVRCLDAHAHLGNMAFDLAVADAVRHYEMGFRIGELSLPEGFDGLLPWGHINNRPFLRCMHGFGLCLWRIGQAKEALALFERMLWLNPADNLGIRFLVDDVRAKRTWKDDA